jgi:hypothetical protein
MSIDVKSVYRSRKDEYDKVDENGNPYFTTDETYCYTFFGEKDGIESYIKKSGFTSYWKVTKADGKVFKLLLLSNVFLDNLSKDPDFLEYFTTKNVFQKNESNEWVRISENVGHDREFFSKLFSKLFKNQNMLNYDGIYTEKSELHPHKEYVISARVKKNLELVGNVVSGSSNSPSHRLLANSTFAHGVKNPNLKKQKQRQRQRQRQNGFTSRKRRRRISYSTNAREGIIKVKVWNLLKNEI